ncbi:MAG: hypothetical protein ACOC3X_01690 [Nanoarchaeota archaeon]
MEKRKGRPLKSQIRQNIIDILFFIKEGYGYDIHKIYLQIFPKCTSKSIYYHLKKGVLLEEFEIKKIKQEKGDYSWGSSVEKIYYKLGKNAKPTNSKRVKEYLDKIKKNENK